MNDKIIIKNKQVKWYPQMLQSTRSGNCINGKQLRVLSALDVSSTSFSILAFLFPLLASLFLAEAEPFFSCLPLFIYLLFLAFPGNSRRRKEVKRQAAGQECSDKRPPKGRLLGRERVNST